MGHKKTLGVVIMLSALCALITTQSVGKSVPPTVIPPGPMAQMSVDWWQWVLDIPLATNPKVDTTGEFVSIGQPVGDVWFLADSFGEGVWERKCDVPKGMALLFPITDAVFWAPEDGKNPPALRAIAREAMDGVTTLEGTLDGVPLADVLGVTDLYALRVESPAFVIPDTLLIDFGLDPGRRLAVSDGFWVYLEDLNVGEHTIWFKMEITSGPFAGAAHEITWHITIVE